MNLHIFLKKINLKKIVLKIGKNAENILDISLTIKRFFKHF